MIGIRKSRLSGIGFRFKWNDFNELSFSGGMKLFVSGQNLDVVQTPMMKFVYNVSVFEFITVSWRDVRIGDVS